MLFDGCEKCVKQGFLAIMILQKIYRNIDFFPTGVVTALCIAFLEKCGPMFQDNWATKRVSDLLLCMHMAGYANSSLQLMSA